MSAGVILRNARLIEAGFPLLKDIFIKDGLIMNLLPAGANAQFACDWFSRDLKGKLVMPGIIESHIHGSDGVDFNHINEEKLEQVSISLASRGVTTFFVSLLSFEENRLTDLLRFYARAAEKDLPGARLAGIHLEGPWISPKRSGAIAAENLKKAKADSLYRYQEAANGKIRYITIAPEIDGGLALIEKADAIGVVVGIGHTEADYDLGREAIARGARLATHFGNAMPQAHQRHPGIVGAILESDLPLELIFDGVHIHPANLCLIARIVSGDRIIGITDSTMARGLPDGVYILGDVEIRVDKGISYLRDSNVLAASNLDPMHAIANATKILDSDAEAIFPFFTSNPSRLFSLNAGEIRVGMQADLLTLTDDYNLCDTWVAGRHVYSAML